MHDQPIRIRRGALLQTVFAPELRFNINSLSGSRRSGFSGESGQPARGFLRPISGSYAWLNQIFFVAKGRVGPGRVGHRVCRGS